MSPLEIYLLLREEKELPTLSDLAKELGYQFKDLNHLAEATTHSSAAQEFNAQNPDLPNLQWNERLEFLGDSVLGLAMTNELMHVGKRFREGELSKIRAALISQAPLVELAKKVKLGQYLALGKSEETTKNRNIRPSILADAFEAVIGAVFMDGGFAASARLVQKLFRPYLSSDLAMFLSGDYKSILQELTQQHYRISPNYDLIATAGPAHQRHFEVSVSIQERVLAQGSGKTKKQASQAAAKKAVELLRREISP